MERKEKVQIRFELPENIKNGQIIEIDIGGHILLVAYKKKDSNEIHPLFALNGWGDLKMEVDDADEIITELEVKI